MLAPEQIHFFSYATGVSLELPAGFVVQSSGDTYESYARYADGDDEGGADERIVAYVDVRTLAAVDASGDDDAGRVAVATAVDAMAAHASEQRDRTWLDIDLERVLRAEFRYPAGLPGAPGPGDGQSARGTVTGFLTGDLMMVFAAVSFGGALVSVSASAPWSAAEEYRKIFAAALASCRFIETEGA